MINDIKNQIEIIEKSIDWAKRFNKDTFPTKEFKEYRRQLRRIASALDENCSAAAYGESQVGKSYLMSSLLSSPDSPFEIENQGKRYSFIDSLNPSGGNNSKTESTGIITRFTLNDDNPSMSHMVKIKNLTVADIIMLLVDSYYNDLELDSDTMLRYDDINNELTTLSSLWNNKTQPVQDVLTEDDVRDILDYVKDVIGTGAIAITHSDYKDILPEKIQFIGPNDWVKVFSPMWNNNAEFSRLFQILISEYAKIKFTSEVYVPFDAVLRDKGTLLKIEWLDLVCGGKEPNPTDILTTDVYDSSNHLLASGFNKSSLSALIAELTFVLPKSIANDRKFLDKIDLLDFPGARAREQFKEKEIGDVLSTVLRRGKVAYLFNKYSRSLKISSVLFCHHNDMKNGPKVGPLIRDWIDTNIGSTPQERTETLNSTHGVSPLFFVATKFNIDLQRTKNDNPGNAELLREHWNRFTKIYPEILTPATWLEKWVVAGQQFRSEAFQSIYLLRDFYWSGKNQVFDGYVENVSAETAVHIDVDYPDYFENLRRNFLELPFVKKHFADPSKAWESVASPNNDGSKPIIRDLDAISIVLDEARTARYMAQVKRIQHEIAAKLNSYFVPEDTEQNNKRVRRIIGDIRLKLDSNVGRNPEIFGQIIDNLMIPVSMLRRIAYDIVTLRTETPKDFNEIYLIRTMAGINPNDDRQVNINKLIDYYVCDDEAEMADMIGQMGFTIDDIVSSECTVAATVADVVSNRILERWSDFINRQTSELSEFIPHADEIAVMLQTLCRKLGVQKEISEKIDVYARVFSDRDLPNAIADFASLTLNNFVSSVGHNYMTQADINAVKEKAIACKIMTDAPEERSRKTPGQDTLIESLQAFDDASDIGKVSFATLIKLPFWNNFQTWKAALAEGLLFSADIAKGDPVANAEIKKIIESNAQLFV